MPAMLAGAPPSPATVSGTTAASAFATLQKVYHSKEDIGFWSTLYSQHHIHTRQDYHGLQDVASAPLAPSVESCLKTQGPIKVWQVLTKTTLENDTETINNNNNNNDNNDNNDNSSSNGSNNSSQLQQPFPRRGDTRQYPQYHFERLPIKVQTSAAALSPHGHPFSIVFFFTVESTPTTLWYLESAFTQSTTVHEHMELMGTFQPNDSKDPMSFYIYETHAFNVDQPLHEDTMLNIHVQSPSGTIYAEFSYTFIRESRNGTTSTVSSFMSITPTSPQAEMSSSSNSSDSNSNSNGNCNNDSSDSSSIIVQQKTQDQNVEPLSPTLNKSNSIPLSPLDSYDIVEYDPPKSLEYFPQQLQQQQQQQQQEEEEEEEEEEEQRHHHYQPQQESSLEDKDNTTPSSPQPGLAVSTPSTQASIPVLVQPTLEENSGDEDDGQELVAGSSFVEEPDAGEHFMQATSEFFSKMGYWLYNSRVVQYIARDDRVRVKTIFPTEDIWILGIRYSLEPNEPTCSLPETSRSRKLSSLQQQTSTSRIGDSKNNTVGPLGPGTDNNRDSKRGWERKLVHASTSPRAMTDNDSIFTFASTAEGSESGVSRSRSKEQQLERQREKEQAKAKKMAQIRERELEKEEKAREKARLKDQEKLQKLKSKISHPRFDPSNLREGTKDLSEVAIGDTKDQLHPYPHIEGIRKSRSIHGYNSEDNPNDGLGLTTPSGEPKQSVIRRMRSISILQKVPNALDALAQKKSVYELQPRVLHDRTHQPRSQSVSNISVFSQRSTGTSSSSSHDGPSKRRPTSPPPPSSMKATMSVHEALAVGPKPMSLSKLSHLNLNQKKLPDLPPPDLNDMPDIPAYPYQDSTQPDQDDLGTHGHAYASVPIPHVSDKDAAEPTSASTKDSKPGRRRMTISGIFSKEPKPSTTGGLAVLKTLVNASKISLRPKAEDPMPSQRHQGPLSVGSTTTATTTISFGPQPSTGRDRPPSSKKGGVTKNMQHWIERRLSSNNLHQQTFVAATDEPVPPVSKGLNMSPPNSPLTTRVDEPDALSQSPERQQLNSQHQQLRSRKKSSIFSTTSSSSAVSSPLSTFKPGSPQSVTSSIRMFGSAYSPIEPLGGQQESASEAHVAFAPSPQFAHSPTLLLESETEKDVTLDLSLDRPVEEKLVCVIPIQAQDPPSSKDIVILPPLPPESPSETFVLLNQEKNSSSVSLERDLEGSVLVSMPDADEASGPAALNDSNQETLVDVDPIRVENQRLFEQLAAFSNDKSESISNLRSEWESLWPSKHEVDQGAGKDSADFVHVQKIHGTRSPALKEGNLTQWERERIRKIGSAYVKVKSPNLEIIAPQPMAPALLQSQVLNRDDSGDIPRSSSPERVDDSSEVKSSSPKSGSLLQLPPMLATTLPPQVYPSSPSPSLSKSWRAISPRSNSPGYSLPFVSSPKPSSSRSASVQVSSSTANKEEEQPTVSEGTDVGSDSSPMSGEISSTLQPSATQLSDKPVSSLSLSANQRTLLLFMSDFRTKFWFTYRKDIARIDPSYYTSDAGWGCMMRTGQSLLAQAFSNVLLGRDWRANTRMSEESAQKYRKIIGWFADEPERPYSIHNIAKSGLYLDKRVGEWFGPSTVAHALKRLSEQHASCPLTLMVPMDTTVRFSDIQRAASEGQGVNVSTGLDCAGLKANHWKPVVLLMPSRFGLDKLTERYVGNLKRLFRLPQFLGIAGGRPGRSLYFIASQGNELFYLDPHFVKPRATQEELSNAPSTSYHCGVVRAMDIMEMDPSMMLGFLIHSAKDLIDLSTRLKNEMERGYPLLTVIEDISLDVQDEDCLGTKDQTLNSAETQLESTSCETTLGDGQGAQNGPESTGGQQHDNSTEVQLQHDHKSDLAPNTDKSAEVHISQAGSHGTMGLMEGYHHTQSHSPPQSKREMKRITKTLKSNVPAPKSLCKDIAPH
ncbi:Cysteine protease atg4, partial [Mortierella sp. AD094]